MSHNNKATTARTADFLSTSTPSFDKVSLFGTPTLPNDAVSKAYVDEYVSPERKRVMCIGDSITVGSFDPGWRSELWRILRQSRGDIQFVGRYLESNPSGNKFGFPNDWHHEGVSGATLVSMRTALDTYAGLSPHIVLIYGGVNDIVNADGETCLQRATTLLTGISEKWPGVKIVMATIGPRAIPRVGEAARLTFNAGLPEVCAAIPNAISVDAGSKMTGMDAQPIDNIHLLHSGYERIARAMADGFTRFFPVPFGRIYPRPFALRPGDEAAVHLQDPSIGGHQDRIEILDPTIELPINQNWLVSVWIRPEALALDQTVWSYGGTYNPQGILCAISPGGGLYLRVDTNAQIVSNGAVLAQNTWAYVQSHFCASTGRYSIWMNGKQVSLTANGIPAVPRSLAPGNRRHYLGYQPASGRLGMAGCYSQYIVATGGGVPSYRDMPYVAEAAYLDADYTGIEPVRYWPLNDGNGTTLKERVAVADTVAVMAGTSAAWAAAGTVNKPYNG